MIVKKKIKGDSMKNLNVEQMYDRYPGEHSLPSLHTKIKYKVVACNFICRANDYHHGAEHRAEIYVSHIFIIII